MLAAVLLAGVAALATAERAALLAELCERAPHVAEHADGWCDDAVPECEWHGVHCNPDDSIFEVSLRGVPLDLALPLQALRATDVERVELSDCGIEGELGALGELGVTGLDLSNNTGLEGFVSVASLGRLQHLRLRSCALGIDLAAALGCESDGGAGFAHLSTLVVADNALTGDMTPCSGAALHMATVFDVSDNALTGRAPVPRAAAVYSVANNRLAALEAEGVELRRVSVPEVEFGGRVLAPAIVDRLAMHRCAVGGNLLVPDEPAWSATLRAETGTDCGYAKLPLK